MATIYDLKPKFQAILRPIVQSFANKGYTPNQITWLALILSLVAGGLMAISLGARWTLFLLPFVLFIRMALNAIDGMLAKEHNMKSDGGAMLNEMTDVVSDVALYLPFALISGVSATWVVLFVIMAIFTEMAGVLGWAVKNDRRYDGPMGKSDRAFVLGFIALLLALGVSTGLWLTVLFIVLTALSAWTAMRRVLKALV
ncbi:MAG: CDP-alcohol phosphatidyltransferase family protein [Epsilonproteobacteria bacterium]|nr:MAG: CDP-alcohol phosphatidyltransferase family protein [Campylobacterota bacterium]